MRVIPYYCAHCGVRISPEDARYGRDVRDDRTFYCPGCVADLEIPVSDSNGVLLTAEAKGSARRGGARAAHELPVTNRRRTPVGGAPRSERSGPGGRADLLESPRSGAPSWVAGAAALALVGALGGAFVFGAFRSEPQQEQASHYEPAPLPAQTKGDAPAREARGSFYADVDPAAIAASSAAGRAAEAAGPAEVASPRVEPTARPVEPAPAGAEVASAPPEEDAGAEVDLLPPPDWAGTKPPAAPPGGAAPTPVPAPTPAPAAPNPPPPPAGSSGGALVVNTRTKTIHKQGCRWERSIGAANRVEVASLDEARAKGFEVTACKTCLGK